MNKTMNLTNDIKIHVPVNNNKLLEKAIEIINNNEEVKTLWQIINTNATERLGMTDHGPVHFQIVANISVKFVRMLTERNIKCQ
jgi:metal-dependent HD superfamily phosphatase/phosphodiesterase